MENIAVYLQKGEFSGREHIDRVLKRLKGKIESEGILETARTKRAFETPAQRKIRKRRKMQKAIKIQKKLFMSNNTRP
jgi:small subunit ribosomal protein S21